jgi:hypothetical protein
LAAIKMDMTTKLSDMMRAVERREMGCHCDPPGSGEEHCTGHCLLRAENRKLDLRRAELAVEVGRLKQAVLAYDDALFRQAPESERKAWHDAMLRLAGRIREL